MSGTGPAVGEPYAVLAIDFVSGPAGLAGWLRTTLLAPPYNTPSLPLDIGYSDTIPASIRRAVLLRDRGCAWPRCGRPAAGDSPEPMSSDSPERQMGRQARRYRR